MENHHLTAAFSVLLSPDCNFLECLPKSGFQRVRKVGVGVCHTPGVPPISPLHLNDDE